jgi:deoxyribodipyrimidine photo-lyase
MIAIYWFRNDLRLFDQPSFKNACAQATRLLPIFIHDSAYQAETRWGFERLGPHRKHALRSALQALKAQLRERQSDLLEYQLLRSPKIFVLRPFFAKRSRPPKSNNK